MGDANLSNKKVKRANRNESKESTMSGNSSAGSRLSCISARKSKQDEKVISIPSKKYQIKLAKKIELMKYVSPMVQRFIISQSTVERYTAGENIEIQHNKDEMDMILVLKGKVTVTMDQTALHAFNDEYDARSQNDSQLSSNPG